MPMWRATHRARQPQPIAAHLDSEVEPPTSSSSSSAPRSRSRSPLRLWHSFIEGPTAPQLSAATLPPTFDIPLPPDAMLDGSPVHTESLASTDISADVSRTPPIPTLEVPLPLDDAEPVDAIGQGAPSGSLRTLPSWFAEPHIPRAVGVFASFYIEPARPGMEPRCCRTCHRAFIVGQLRAGYTPCGATSSGSQIPPVWIHAFDCLRQTNLAMGQISDQVGFSPTVSVANRQRILEELRSLPRVGDQVPSSHREASANQTPPLCIRPWRYVPALLQRWTMVPVSDRNRRRLPVPVPSPTPAALSARAALRARTQANASRQQWAAPAPSSDSSSRDLEAQQVQEVLEHLLFAGQRQREIIRASATSGILNSMPVQVVKARMREPCAICKDAIHVGETARRLPCLHLFHQCCIDRWFQVKTTCPLCNLSVEDMVSAQQSFLHEADQDVADMADSGNAEAEAESRIGAVSEVRHEPFLHPNQPHHGGYSVPATLQWGASSWAGAAPWGSLQAAHAAGHISWPMPLVQFPVHGQGAWLASSSLHAGMPSWSVGGYSEHLASDTAP